MKLFLLLLLLPFGTVFAEEPMIFDQITEDGSILVQLHWPEVVDVEQIYDIEFSFLDPNTKKPITSEIHYRVSSMNQDQILELWTGTTVNGSATHEFLFPEGHDGLSSMYAEIFSITDESGTIENYQEVMFSVNVIPEFSIMVLPILVVSTLLIIVMTRKYSVNLKF